MLVRGGIPDIFLCVFILLIANLNECSAQVKGVKYVSEDYWRNHTPLKCYDCNSEYDPNCGDPFNNYSIGIVDCSKQKPPEHLIDPERKMPLPIVCRKIVQKVENRKRVIRVCGYIEDDRDDKTCTRRTGTKNVETSYCACTKSLCNEGFTSHPSIFILVLSLVISVVSFLCMSLFI